MSDLVLLRKMADELFMMRYDLRPGALSGKYETAELALRELIAACERDDGALGRFTWHEISNADPEEAMQPHCSQCGEPGHTAKTCLFHRG